MNETICILIQISLKFVPKDTIDNKAALVQAWLGAEQATGNYLSQYLPSSLTHICSTRGRWVNVSGLRRARADIADVVCALLNWCSTNPFACVPEQRFVNKLLLINTFSVNHCVNCLRAFTQLVSTKTFPSQWIKRSVAKNVFYSKMAHSYRRHIFFGIISTLLVVFTVTTTATGGFPLTRASSIAEFFLEFLCY